MVFENVLLIKKFSLFLLLQTGIVSNATKSVRAPIRNISDANPHVNVPQLLSALG